MTGGEGLRVKRFKTLDGRVCYIDNIRFLLILLVVCMHFIDHANAYPQLFKFIYTFHMPVFVFVTGYFAKTEDYIRKAAGVFVVYLLFNTLIYLMDVYCFHQDIEYQIFSPKIGMWYLLALFLWHLFFPAFERVKPVVLMPFLFAAGILSGLDNSIGSFLTLSRFFVFTPFYMLGYYANKRRWLYCLREIRWVRPVALLVLIVYAVVVFRYDEELPIVLFTAKRSFEKMQMQAGEGVLYRILFYVLALLVGTAFVALVPAGRRFFTHLGRNTLSVYLLHLVVLNTLIEMGSITWIYEHLTGVALLGLGVFFTFLFAGDLWQKPLHRLLRFDLPILTEDTQEKSREGNV